MAKDSLRFLGDPTSPVNCTCDILDKDTGRYQYVQYMFDRTNRMFRYHNLPDTIPEPMLEYMLQIYGSVAIIENDGELYAMRCEFGGPPDPYYRPTQAIVANPALGISKTFKIINHLPPFDTTLWSKMPDCIRFLNDTQIMGLFPLFSRYAQQMTENDVSIRSAQINLRQQTVIAVDNGPEMESAQQYLSDIEAGKLGAIGRRPFLEGINVTNTGQGQSNVVIQLIELQQYLKASWYNEIGLNSNFNMKRQYMSADEINSSADIMLPLIDNMYECRVQAIELINKHFGTDITVEKDSAWEKKQLQSDLSVVPEDGDYPLSESTMEKSDEIVQTEQDTNSSQLNSDEPIAEPQEFESTNENSDSSQLDSTNEESEPESILEEIGEAVVEAAAIAVSEIIENQEDDTVEESEEENDSTDESDS